jgi:hypothetical protein
MVKVLLVLAGVLIKQLVDELKKLNDEKVAKLLKQAEDAFEYRPVAALQQGSPEAHRAMLRAQHEANAAPEVRRLAKLAKRYRLIPSVAYAALLATTMGLIAYLD